jgi:ubiquinone/menaquinone biosynthesis C-methylase UbiE
MKNIDKKTVDGFGEEWNKYNQSSISQDELKKSWNQYFDIFPFDKLDAHAEGFDMGCGSGRWAKFVADKVHILNCIDPSDKALNVAKKNLSNFSNIQYFNASVSDNILEENSQDFGYCLGVLHHIPDTPEGIKACGKLLKKDAPFLLYLYYDFENRSIIFRSLWKLSDIIRKIISSLPSKIKTFVTIFIALLVYYPLARSALLCHKLGFDVFNFPLSDYKDKTFYFMKTDALDRFGTRLEKRFSRDEIRKMLNEAGFHDINFSQNMPFWVCISRKK